MILSSPKDSHVKSNDINEIVKSSQSELTLRPPIPPNKPKTHWSQLVASLKNSHRNVDSVSSESNKLKIAKSDIALYTDSETDRGVDSKNSNRTILKSSKNHATSPDSFFCASALSLLSKVNVIDCDENSSTRMVEDYPDANFEAGLITSNIFSNRSKRSRSSDSTSEEDTSETSPNSTSMPNHARKEINRSPEQESLY
jgi:hypothetical protein